MLCLHNATGLTFKVVDIQSVHELSPPGLAPRVGGTLQVVLGQLPCQVDEGHSNGLGLPLQTQCRAKTVSVCMWKEKRGTRTWSGETEINKSCSATPVVHKRPCHLHQFLNLPLITCNQGNQTRLSPVTKATKLDKKNYPRRQYTNKYSARTLATSQQ